MAALCSQEGSAPAGRIEVADMQDAHVCPRVPALDDDDAGLTISFSGEIPVIGGNGIPFRNFGKFRRISVDFERNLLNFEFENKIYQKIPKFRIPVTGGNRKKIEISPKS